MLIVKKYGGTSVSTPEKILAIAQHLKKIKSEGQDLIVIVSAMGDTTDNLIELTHQITNTPIQREMDMLLSSGERISMSLMAIALNSIGVEAISFTGSQSGVFTDSSHSNARIDDIKAFRVKEEVEKGKVVIIAGFQGVNPQTKEVTTLGRGGSDTTAVAMAAAFHASRCDILTDVEGIYSGNPRIENLNPRHYSHLDFDVTLEMAYWGASVLHYRSVELAERNHLPLTVNLSLEQGQGTLIESKPVPTDSKNDRSFKMEKTEVMAVNCISQVACLKLKNMKNLSEALSFMSKGIKAVKLPPPQIIYQRAKGQMIEIFLSLPEENFQSLAKAMAPSGDLDGNSGTVTLTGRGLVNSLIPFEASQKLADQNILFDALVITPLSITFVIPKESVKNATQILHAGFCQ